MMTSPISILSAPPRTRSPPPFTFPTAPILPYKNPEPPKFQITPIFENYKPSVYVPVNKLPSDGGYLVPSIPSPYQKVIRIENSVPVETIEAIHPIILTSSVPPERYSSIPIRVKSPSITGLYSYNNSKIYSMPQRNK